MKRATYAILCMLLATSIYGQCRFIINEVDPMDGKKTVITEDIDFASNDSWSYALSFSQIGNSRFLSVKVSADVIMNMSIEKGSILKSKFSDNTLLELEVNKYESTDFSRDQSYVSHTFRLTEEQFQMFIDKDLEMINLGPFTTAVRNKVKKSLKVKEAALCVSGTIN